MEVREEDFVLARDFRALAAHFQLTVHARLERDLIRLMAAFEAIDRHVDARPGAAERAILAEQIVAMLEGGPRLPGELGACLDQLRTVLTTPQARFVAGSLRRFFAHSEELRT